MDCRLKLYSATTLILICFTQFAQAANSGSNWFQSDINLGTKIMTVPTPDQSRAWATCAVAYEFSALIYGIEDSSSAAVSEQQNMANGARLASGIVFVFDSFKEETPTPVEFQAKWKLAQLAMNSNYETISTSAFASFERDQEGMLQGHVPTYEICWSWREEQQTYVDFWRELYGSGLLD